jgi:site-specific DNA-methyltransferase (adenine-specific)
MIIIGDVRAVLATLPDCSVDSIVTDPPYELTTAKRTVPPPYVEGSPYSRHRVGVNGDSKPKAGFMGHEWDGGGIAHDVAMWADAMRVLKPGGYLLAFSGTRTQHRMVCAIEDAGFEIRDQIGWVYGSGFPKSINLGEGRGSALKPAWEPICVARKPFKGTLTACVAEHGTGGLNIDACRVGDEVRHAAYTSLAPCHGNALGKAGTAEARRGTQGEPKEYVGRWPANLIHDGSDEVLAVFPQAPGQLADAVTDDRPGTRNTYGEWNGRHPAPVRLDSGSASRFFYCAKASRSDRGGEFNTHPTVKPINLMAYLCRLVTPRGGTVLDLFTGSGSTGVGAIREGFKFIGIERDPDYAAIAICRTLETSLPT